MKELSDTRWREINDVLDKVYELPTGQQLTACKDFCGENKDLLAVIERLIASERQAPAYLDSPAVIVAAQHSRLQQSDQEQSTLDALQGQRFGVYELREKLGQGGMGVVYRAERIKGDFKQQVAIKILSNKTNGGRQSNNHGRFKREQQLLASLNHVNIAQLYDGGVEENGFAYFILEYVCGTPVDRYCYEQTLSLDSILHLIKKIAQTLQFAHGQLIIHRDIKASNILVNEKGEIKLLDFGIAKLADNDQQLSLTSTGEQILTPGCAAPEQLLNKNITVATDMYQLGLLAYELITGLKAHQGRAQSLAELIHLTCKEKVPTPSLAIRQHLQKCEGVMTQTARQTMRSRQHRVKGDIDAILLKMLHTEPSQRYQSMEALQNDITAYFHKRPVKARQLSLNYQGKRFMQRHWRGIGFTSFIFFLSTAYFANVKIQSEKTETALANSLLSQKKSEEISSFLINIFKAADPYRIGTEKISARALLEQGQLRAEQDLTENPLIQAHMLVNLGEINQSLGEHKKSLALFEQALVIHRKILEEQSPEIAHNLWLLGSAHEYLGDYQLARDMYQNSVDIYWQQTLSDDYHDMRLQALNELGEVQFKLGELALAQENFQRVVDDFRRRNVTEHRVLAVGLNNLALIYHRKSKLTAAKNAMLEAISINEKILGEDHPKLALSLRNLAVKLTDWEKLSEARGLMLRALELQERSLGEIHPEVLNTKRHLAYLFHKEGKLIEAESLLIEVLKLQTNNDGDSVDMAMSHYRLAEIQTDAGNTTQAQMNYKKMMDIYLGSDVSNTIIGRGIAGQAKLALRLNRLDNAEALYHNALDLLPKKSMRTSMTQLGLAQVLLKTQRAQQALEEAKEVLSFRNEKLPRDHNLSIEANIVIAIAEAHLGQDKAQALARLTDAFTLLGKRRHKNDSFVRLAAEALNLDLNKSRS